MKTFALLLTAALALAAGTTGRGEIREFKSAKGTTIRAELKKAKGQTIILKSETGQELQVPLASFAKDDQDFILKWITEDPLAIDYNFVCRADEKLLKDTKSTNRSYYSQYSAVQKNYDVSVLNSCRNAIDNLSVEWRVFLLNRVDPSGSYNYASKQEVFFKSGAEELPVLNYNGSFRFSTKPYVLHSLKDSYSNNGATVKDKLLGVWLRFYRHGQMVAEWKSVGTPKCEWPAVAKKETGPPKEPQVAANTENKDKPETKPTAPATPAPAVPTTPTTPGKTDPTPNTADNGKKPTGEDDSDATLLKIFELDDGAKK